MVVVFSFQTPQTEHVFLLRLRRVELDLLRRQRSRDLRVGGMAAYSGYQRLLSS